MSPDNSLLLSCNFSNQILPIQYGFSPALETVHTSGILTVQNPAWLQEYMYSFLIGLFLSRFVIGHQIKNVESLIAPKII